MTNSDSYQNSRSNPDQNNINLNNITSNAASRKFLLVAIIGISFSLRSPITSIGPLAGLIHDDLNVSNGFIGFITTLPLIAFAVCSPLIPKVSERFGIGKTTLAGLAVIAVGGALRAYTGIAGLLIGTALVGMGISVANVLMPSIVKMKFPERIGLVTGIYLTSVAVMASIGAGISYPLAISGLGWRATSMVWAAVAVIAVCVWFPQRNLDGSISTKQTVLRSDGAGKKSIWKSPLAWCLTFFFGFQSFNYYSLTAWIPSILQSNGATPVTAGYMALWFQLIGIPSSFMVPILAARMKSQRTIVVSSCAAYFLGFVMLAAFHSNFAVLVALLFLSNGGTASFSWSMAMLSLKTKDGDEAVKLSGMTQTVGYMLSATGPTLSGAIFDTAGTWSIVFGLFFATTTVMIASGILASKREKLF